MINKELLIGIEKTYQLINKGAEQPIMVLLFRGRAITPGGVYWLASGMKLTKEEVEAFNVEIQNMVAEERRRVCEKR